MAKVPRTVAAPTITTPEPESELTDTAMGNAVVGAAPAAMGGIMDTVREDGGSKRRTNPGHDPRTNASHGTGNSP